MKLSLILLSPFASFPGHWASRTQTLAEALSAHAEVIVVAPWDARIESNPEYHLETFRTSGSSTQRPRSFLTIKAVRLASRLKTSRQVDLVHAIDGSHIPLLMWGRASRTPLVYSAYGDPPRTTGGLQATLRTAISKSLFRSLARSSSLAVLCETPIIRKRWHQLVHGQAVLIPYAVEDPSAPMDKHKARSILDLPPDGTAFLMFGTHRESKDYETVIAAASRLQPNPLLVFAGQVISSNDPASLIDRTGYPNAAVHNMYVSADRAALYFCACDAAVLPYERGYAKGSGVLLEACRFGTPVIATAEPHFRDFVNTYECGLLFNHGDAEDLAEVMNRFAILSPKDRERFRAEAVRAAHDHSWSVLVTDYLRAYEDLLQSRAQQGSGAPNDA